MHPESEAKYEADRDADESADAQSIAHWICRPWYAKLWWALMPIYWLGAALSREGPPLDAFYSSALAGFMNVFMFPPTALMILGAGFVRGCIGPVKWRRYDLFDPAIGCRHEIGRPLPEFDPLDPRSGVFWIGSPENPINQHRHS